jgi:hypothetical protein
LLTSTPDRWPDFQQDLLAILGNPQIKSFALRRAGDSDLADDALQATFYAVSRVADPAAIRNLRAYCYQVLTREIYRLRGQFRVTLVEDITRVADTHQGRSGDHLPVSQSIDEMVCTHLLAEAWFGLFVTRREELAANVPGRSTDPGRYRDMIVTVAERVLGHIIVSDISDADGNAALRAVYQEWFDEPGCTENTRHQRFRRGRADIRALLRSLIDRKDLDP